MDFPLKYQAIYRTQRQAAISCHPDIIGLQLIDIKAQSDYWILSLKFVSASSTLPEKCSIPSELLPNNIQLTTISGQSAPFEITDINFDSTDNTRILIILSPSPYISKDQFSTVFILKLININNLDPYFADCRFVLNKRTDNDPEELSFLPPSLKLKTEIDYQAKDYNSFRKLMLDHLALLVPQWQERHIADLGIALVEVLAYAADYLSYYQDAVATESYLGTARQRISMRRHARLLDYLPDEGSGARVWVQIIVQSSNNIAIHLPAKTPLLTKRQALPDTPPPRISTNVYSEWNVLEDDIQQFETLTKATLYPEHNTFHFYVFESQFFILEKGIKEAKIDGHFPNLKSGDVLVIEEVKSLTRQDIEDVDDTKRHAVRLTSVSLAHDQLYDSPYTEICWHEEDALPFSMQISGHNLYGVYLQDIYVIRGNIVLADYGKTIHNEVLSPVPLLGSYYPKLKFGGLTYSIPYDLTIASNQPANQIFQTETTIAQPAIVLHEDWPGYPVIENTEGNKQKGYQWLPRPDLLNCGPFIRAFVVETEEDGSSYLRFGDGHLGQKPISDHQFSATYRIGNGPMSNVGIDSIAHIVSDDQRIVGVRNPLPARGGRTPESIEQIRLNAPEVFRVQKRCVTEADYSNAIKDYPGVRQVTVQRKLIGGLTTFVSHIDCWEWQTVDRLYIEKLYAFLQPLRIVGTQLYIRPANYVPLVIELKVLIQKGESRNRILGILKLAFSTLAFPKGELGFFHPSNFTFGQPLYQSQVVSKAVQVMGVNRVEIMQFRRYGQPEQSITSDVLIVDSSEIVQVMNLPQQPEQGSIHFELEAVNDQSI